MLPIARSVTVTVCALALSACATTMTVSSHVDRGLDFARYRTWDWGPADTLPTGDPRLDADPFFKDHLQGAIEKGLAARGLTMSSSGAPDLQIHYHASINQRVNVSGADTAHGVRDGDDNQGLVEYEAGTIVVDVVDARTNRVIWRGWAQDSLDGALDNQDLMAKKIDEAVTRMLLRLPKR